MSGKTKQPKHKMSAMAKKEERTAWLFIALPFLGFLLFMAYPICFAVFASMSKWTGMNSLVDNFCGLQNYINIFMMKILEISAYNHYLSDRYSNRNDPWTASGNGNEP